MRILALLCSLGGCTSLEGFTRDLGHDAQRFDDVRRWSSPGRSFGLEIVRPHARRHVEREDDRSLEMGVRDDHAGTRRL